MAVFLVTQFNYIETRKNRFRREFRDLLKSMGMETGNIDFDKIWFDEILPSQTAKPTNGNNGNEGTSIDDDLGYVMRNPSRTMEDDMYDNGVSWADFF